MISTISGVKTCNRSNDSRSSSSPVTAEATVVSRRLHVADVSPNEMKFILTMLDYFIMKSSLFINQLLAIERGILSL